MGRSVGSMLAVAAALVISASPAAAQVRIGVHTPGVGFSMSVGAPRVYVVDRGYAPHYRYERGYRPRPGRGWERSRRDREYYRDVRRAQREYAREVRDARRDYARDIREARRDRRR